MSHNLIPEQTFWQKTKRFFEPLQSNRLFTFTVVLEFFFWSLLWILAILFIREITIVLETGVFEDFLLVLGRFSILFVILMLLSVSIMNYGWVRFHESLRDTLYRKYLPVFIRLDNNSVEREGTGKINHLLQQGVNAHITMLNDVLYNFVMIFPFLIFTLYFIFQQSYILGGVYIISYIGLLFYAKYFDWKQVIIRRDKHILKKEISRNITKIIMSKSDILQNSQISNELDKISSLHSLIIKNNRKQNIWGMILFRGVETILFIMRILLLFLVGNEFFQGNLSLSYIITFITVIIYFEKNAQDFLIFYKSFTRDIHEMTGLWSFFDSTPQITGYEEGNTFKYKSGNIELKNISYSYTEETPVFQNFNLKIQGGKVTALVGPSGGGKSTLVKLISGYIKSESGEILIDGQKLSETSLKSYYQTVGYLTQEPSVFDGSVRENLMYGVSSENTSHLTQHTSSQPSPLREKEQTANRQKNAASLSSKGERIQEGGCLVEEDVLKNIITLAHCEFIYDLPNGLDTEIGERGVKLSGGQKQRLAIAKIFLKNPSIIILDEPTSALDSLSEKKITEAMHNLFKDRTVLVIAHRLQTVKHADDIIVIDSGNILERGTHTELISKNGYYADMLELQSGF